jgi:hypothetical protein
MNDQRKYPKSKLIKETTHCTEFHIVLAFQCVDYENAVASAGAQIGRGNLAVEA